MGRARVIPELGTKLAPSSGVRLLLDVLNDDRWQIPGAGEYVAALRADLEALRVRQCADDPAYVAALDPLMYEDSPPADPAWMPTPIDDAPIVRAGAAGIVVVDEYRECRRVLRALWLHGCADRVRRCPHCGEYVFDRETCGDAACRQAWSRVQRREPFVWGDDPCDDPA